ncbi:MAG TPA: HEAT repeat domain-containing protein [Nitrospira sp.]|nr:HEAT repeat domain-containing protein [Nitrospira sp.]
MRHRESGHANLTAVFLLLGVVIAGVWIWKRLTLEMQEYVIDQAIPLALAGALCIGLLVVVGRVVRRRNMRRGERERLLRLFEREPAREKRLEIAFELIEINGYRVKGLESAVPAMKELFSSTLQRALGDKQHRIRGMAASHLGVLGDKSVVPLLVKALEDDHAYVRACAALGLGRLRATETRDRLASVMKDDWDQTVRSRAKEAVERMGGC